MSDDFDNDLPEWMRGGEPDGDDNGEEDTPEFDWQQNADQDDAPRSDQPRLGVTGQLSWLRDTDGDDDTPRGADDDLPAFDWQSPDTDETPRADTGKTGVTGELNWIAGVHDRFEQQIEEAEAAASQQQPRDLFDDEDNDLETGGDDELPDWMRGSEFDDDASDSGLFDDSAAEDDSEEETPAWMGGGSLFADEDVSADEDSDSLFYEDDSEEETPAWMSSGVISDDLDDLAETVEDDSSLDLPPWMQGAAFPDDESGTEQDDVPDWMRGAEPGSVFGGVSPEEPEKEEVPAWLQSSSPFVGAEEDDDYIPQSEMKPDEGIPEWLRGTDSSYDTDDSVVEEEEPADEGIPSWLAGTSTFGQNDTPIATAEDSSVDFDSLFDNAPEDAGEPAIAGLDEDDLLAQLAGGDDSLDDLLGDLGNVDFDLLGEIAGDSGGAFDLLDEIADDKTMAVEFDLLGELAQETEAATMVSDLDSLFGDNLEDVLAAAERASSAPVEDDDDLSSLFGDDSDEDEPFAIAEETADDDLDNFFGDMNAQDASDEGEFDFSGLGEPEVEEEPVASETDFASLFGDDQTFGQDAAYSQAEHEDFDFGGDDDLDVIFGGDDAPGIDEDFIAGMGIGEQSDTGDWFAEEIGTESQPDWLNELEDVDTLFGDQADSPDLQFEEDDEDALLPADADFLSEFAPPGMAGALNQTDDLEDFLSSLDDNALELPKTGELSLGTDFEFDELFSDKDLESFRKQKDTSGIPSDFSPDAPDWLGDIAKESAGAGSAAAAISGRPDRPLEELSDRLKILRERGFELPSPTTRGHTGMLSSVLPSVSGTLPPASIDLTSVSAAATEGLVLTDIQRERVTLLQGVVGHGSDLLTADSLLDMDGEEKAKDAPKARKQRRVRFLADRVVITLVLFLAMVLPFVPDAFQIGDLPPASFAVGSHQDRFVAQVSSLQPGDLVLVAAEYGAASAAELDEASEAVLLHSLLRGARPVIIGGNPVGLLHTSNLMERIADENDTLLVRNRDFYVGRYLVGDVVGLRAFGGEIERILRTDIRGEQTGLEITSLDEFAAVIIITDRSDRLQAWAEQIAPTTHTPLLVITGAGAAPLSQPYLDANPDKIMGWMVGFGDAYTYRGILSPMLGEPVPPTKAPTQTQQPDNAGTPQGVVVPETTQEVTDEATQEVIPTATFTPTPSPTLTETPTSTPTLTPTNTPTPTHTPEPVVYGIVTSSSRINIRNGPSTTSAPVASLAPGSRVLVIGQSEDGEWLNVLLDDGTEGWTASFLLELLSVPWDATLTPTPAQGANAGKQEVVKLAKLLLQPGVQPPSGSPGPGGLPFGQPQSTSDGQSVPLPFGQIGTPGAQVTSQPGGGPPPVDTGGGLPFVMTATPTLERELPFQTVLTVTVTQSPPPTAILTATPSPTLDTSLFADRKIIAPQRDANAYRDERWYSMTAGIVISACVIAAGNIISILRGLRRRRKGN